MGSRKRKGFQRDNRAESNLNHHPKNPYYSARPDFAALARENSDFAEHVVFSPDGRAHVNLRSRQAQVELAKALLRKDFDIEWSLPEGHLCPAVPSRIDYLLWANDLSTQSTSEGTDASRILVDVGTGASCIYPLLSARLLADVRCIAVDNDLDALEIARGNVSRNGLENAIDLREGSFFSAVRPDEEVSISVCNPPFYGDSDSVGAHPHRINSGTEAQMVTEGGELLFLKRLAQESSRLSNARWFSSLVGLKRDVFPFEQHLKELGAEKVIRTTFRIARTARWAVAWSFGAPSGARITSLQPSRSKVQVRWRGKSSSHVIKIVQDFVVETDSEASKTTIGIRTRGIEVIVWSTQISTFEIEMKKVESSGQDSSSAIADISKSIEHFLQEIIEEDSSEKTSTTHKKADSL